MRPKTLAQGLVLVGALAFAPSLGAQVPERFTNLKVLPADISRGDLVRTMRAWTSALGVRCGHCHEGGDPDTLKGVDFPSDAKWEKRTARSMFRMMQAVQGDHLAQLENRAAAPAAPAVVLTCATCHHGLVRPESLDRVLERVVENEGAEAAVRQYRELRAKYLDRGSYDFSERSVNTLAERLLERKQAKEAAVLLTVSAEFNPEAAWLHHLLGEAWLAAGDRDQARAAFTRAVQLNPDNPRSRDRLAELSARKTEP